jgi:hypothetical protein
MAQKMLYRAGSKPNPAVDNLHVEHTVIDKADLDKHLADGWYASPADIPAKAEKPDAPETPLSLLDESAATITETLPALTPDELKALLDAENAGKARKGVTAALEKAIAG